MRHVGHVYWSPSLLVKLLKSHLEMIYHYNTRHIWFSFIYIACIKGGVPPPKHALKFCQFVETMPKGLNIIIFFGFDILLRTLKNFQKMKKCVFPAILRVVLKVILTQSPAFTKPFKKILITQFCSACSTLREDIFFVQKKNLFCSTADWKTCLCP